MDHCTSDVLSEGEQKVIPLADFLAEASLKTPAPVVFDDPINGLDYRRMGEVVDRIVALSGTCQVSVFNHNIWFRTELRSRFEERPEHCSYYDAARYDVARDGAALESSARERTRAPIRSPVSATGSTR